jgi:hypothetical protein
MKLIRIAMTLAVLFAPAFSRAETNAQKSFETLKSLAGDWVGKSAQGRPVEVTYRLTAGGTALMSEIKTEDNMITVFNLDGDRIVMTHYCTMGNQPRMQASAPPDGKTFTFEFLDATGLASPDSGHMHRLVLILPDANHHSEDWTFVKGGKETTERFELQRKN